MHKILFVCHGNICRSPMAEFIMKQLVKECGMAQDFTIRSAATSREELGNGVYPPAKRTLWAHGIPCGDRAATQMTKADYCRYDVIVGMDSMNRRNILRITGGDPAQKVSLLLDSTPHPRDVADPWYSGDFETAFRDIDEGCRALLAQLLQQND